MFLSVPYGGFSLPVTASAMPGSVIALTPFTLRICPRQELSSLAFLCGRGCDCKFPLGRRQSPGAFFPPALQCRAATDAAALRPRTSPTELCLSIATGKGHAEPLGVQYRKDGSANFAIFSRTAEKVVLCLYEPDIVVPSLELELYRTGDIWHIELETLQNYTRYGYRCTGDSSWEAGNRFHSRCVLLDPYAKHVAAPVPGQENLPSPALALGRLSSYTSPFDWEDDVMPRIPLHKLVVYKMSVHGYTSDISSKIEEDHRGTFMGVTQKVDHLLRLGVNSVMLQPVFASDDTQGSYHPISFFAPSAIYGLPGDDLSASASFKQMVKELHRNSIEVILEVVYSHTAENGDDRPKTISFRGIDNATYYILDQNGRVAMSDMGAENLLNCNHPVVTRLILDSLRHWVEEYHVDGFCFVHASALVTGPHGQELSRPPVVESVSFDPLLAHTKLIASPCSPISGICKDITFPHWRRWCEWNFLFRDNTRRMMRGEQGMLSSFATRLCGSGDIFAKGRGPSFSMNFVTSSYGLTLADLVSYSDIEAGDIELSWNCGEEGPTADLIVLQTRIQQVGNYLMALFLSQGTPVLTMGDEYGHSKGGSTSVEDSSYPFDWDSLEGDFGQQMTSLVLSLVTFRTRRNDLYQRQDFIDLDSVSWHGLELNKPQWESPESCFIAVSLRSTKPKDAVVPAVGDLYIAFNSHNYPASAALPDPPEGMKWHRIADTSLPFPENFIQDGIAIQETVNETRGRPSYQVQSYSSILLEARTSFSSSQAGPSVKEVERLT